MTSLQFCLLCIAVQCFLIKTALSQTVVDNKHCQKLHLNCGATGKESKKYCCAESSGNGNLFKCCNPYIGLIIGLCVGVPLIIMIIVAVVVLYCCCARYHNKKMLSLALARRNRRNNPDESSVAPPPYSQQKDSELPSYTVTDPYALCRPPSYNGQDDQTANTTENVDLQSSLVEPEAAPLLHEES